MSRSVQDMSPEERWLLCHAADALHICEHTDGDVCLICLYEMDHGCDLDEDTITISAEGHA
jgi:hypothetical protein